MKQEISSDLRFVYTRKPHAVIYLNEIQKKFFFDLSGKLYVSVLSVKVVVERVDFVLPYGGECIVNEA